MSEMNDLAKEFEYFTSHHKELYNEYPDKFVVIRNCKIEAVADSFERALDEARKLGLESGAYLVQECTKDESGFTQTFHSRAIFA